MNNNQHRFRPPAMPTAILLSLAALVLTVGTVLAQESSIVRFSIGSAGGSVQTESLVLRGAVGQSIAGSVQNASSNGLLCGGLQCGPGAVAQATATPITPTPETPTPETPTPDPSETVTAEPTGEPTSDPTSEPTGEPTSEPTGEPTGEPTSEPTDTPAPKNEDIVISEVYYGGASADQDWIELRNTGSSPIDISKWWFCSLFSYQTLSQMTLAQGADLILDPGEVIVLQSWTDLNNSAADLGLYSNDPSAADGRPDFGSPAFMVDFLQWGTADDVGRSDVAAAKGIWPETSTGVYDFIPTAASGQSVALTSSNSGSAASDFANGEQSQGQPNTPLGTSSMNLFLPFVAE